MSYGFDECRLQVINNIPVRCVSCGNEFFIGTDELEYDTNSEYAPMGARVTYTFFTECACPRCGQEILFRQAASEYPEGAIDSIYDPECDGGEVLLAPEIDFYDGFYDDEIYVSDAPIHSSRYESKPTVLDINGRLGIDVVDGDAYIGDQLYLPNKQTTIWLNTAGRLLPILVEETGSIRFEDNRAVFAEILQKNPKIGAMRLLGKVAEAVIVRNCIDDVQLNRDWLSKARKNHTTQRIADSFQAVGTGLHSTKVRFPHKYSPSDTQRDIIWINGDGECALVADRHSTSGIVAGLQIKVSSEGSSYVKRALTQRQYEVPLVYFPINEDYEMILDKVNRNGIVVEPGIDFIDVRELDEDAFSEVRDYYPLLFNLFAGRMIGDEFVREATRITPLRNGIFATTMSVPKSEIRIIH